MIECEVNLCPTSLSEEFSWCLFLLISLFEFIPDKSIIIVIVSYENYVSLKNNNYHFMLTNQKLFS